MGVDITTYLFYGIKIDGTKFEKDFKSNNPEESDWFYPLLPEIEGHPDIEFDIIFDSIGGKYVALGKIIESVDRDDENFYTISVDKLPNPDKMIEAINKKLNSSYEHSEFKLLLFNNFH